MATSSSGSTLLLVVVVLVNGMYDVLCFLGIFCLPRWHQKQTQRKKNAGVDGSSSSGSSRWNMAMEKVVSMLGEMHSSVFLSPMMNEDDDYGGDYSESNDCSSIQTVALPKLQRRVLAYWILTYGLVRVLCALFLLFGCAFKLLLAVVSSTYFVECFAFGLEDLLFLSTVRSKSAWIYGTSFALGVWSLLVGIDKL
jgi:hypothetical protein